jgi:hypothetical protein
MAAMDSEGPRHGVIMRWTLHGPHCSLLKRDKSSEYNHGVRVPQVLDSLTWNCVGCIVEITSDFVRTNGTLIDGGRQKGVWESEVIHG